MKKILVSITLVCYLAVSSGIVVNFHYCMNRLASTQLFGTAGKVCGKCGMPSKKAHGCCRDEMKIVKMQNDQNKVSVSYSLQAPAVVLAVPSSFFVIPVYTIDQARPVVNHPPPLLSGQDTYLQNCVFRI